MDHELTSPDASSLTWLRLRRATGIGPKSLWKLVQAAAARSSSVPRLLEEPSGPAGPGNEIGKLRTSLDAQDVDALAAELRGLWEKRVTVLHPDHPSFPRGVMERGSEFGVPPVLFTRGHVPLARARGVAIVGSRNVEDDGLQFAERLAGGLAEAGWNVVSGLARGVDAAAHAGALRAGGTTTMVLALGILNFEARAEIRPLLSATNSLVVSQFHPRARWMARQAMARNKLVCALSEAVVVVASGPELDEQGRASGTFDAARTGQAMGLPVFVLSPRSLRSPPLGNAALLRMGCRELLPDDPVAQIARALESPAFPPAHREGQQIAFL